ncbi:hypothetical protein BDB00DRAFT_497702 [Zychaea mexicana]|uniref:uncharacterized protein n=1 Tax=Zychaea mexicana TaxID=64656 RepID=UPI0022FEA03D|nr:uncharacterized protein BDB00DRAFT_497702 [Zychaea mexicana]KAI9498075.1 hypothetical protein BDB00DRAFT_497702 [Zychaea mexicana]
MTKTETDDGEASLLKERRTMLPNYSEANDIYTALENLVHFWHQCVQKQQKVADDDGDVANVKSSLNAIDRLNNCIVIVLLDIRAQKRTKRKEYAEAQKDVVELIDCASRLAAIGYRHAAGVCIQRGRFDDADAIYRKGLINIKGDLTSSKSSSSSSDYDILQAELQDLPNRFFADRIAELVARCQMTKAQRLAQQWIQRFPHTAQAYMTSGDIYVMQGNCHQAAKVYKLGQEQEQRLFTPISLSPSSTSLHVMFECKLKTVRAQRDKRIDFISELPFDVATSFLPFLPITCRIECMSVSKTWWERISECSSAWRTAVVPDLTTAHKEAIDYNCYNSDILFHHIQHRGVQYVRELQLGPYLGRYDLNQWLRGCDHRFKHLETLVINYVSYIDPDTLVSCLKRIGSTLKKLDISLKCGTSYSGSNNVLACVWKALSEADSRITHLAFQDAYDTTSFSTDTVLPVIPSLTHLLLSVYWLTGSYQPNSWLTANTQSVDLSYVHLEIICKACPNLYFLKTICPPSGLDTIRQHCTRLQYLWINGGTDDDSRNDRICFTSFGNDDLITVDYGAPSHFLKNGKEGLRSLIISDCPNQNGQSIYKTLEENKDTLKELLLHGEWFEGGQQSSWQILGNFGSTQLCEINWETEHLELSTFLQLIQQCPNLDSIKIANVKQATDRIFDALLELRHLKRLNLENCKNITAVGLQRFFSLSNTPQYRQQLKHLKLTREVQWTFFSRVSYHHSSSVFDALGNMQYLNTLCLRRGLEGRHLERIIDKLTLLESITLIDVRYITRNCMAAISRLPCLKRVEFVNTYMTYGSSKDVMLDVLNESQSLESIIVQQSY